jgi:hypothetical protein
MVHSTLSDRGRKTTSASFVAFERSIKAGLDSPGNRSKLLVWVRMPNGRTNEVTGNAERFKGIRTPLHQRCYRQKVFLA